MSTPFYEGTNPLVSDRYILTFIAGEALYVGDWVEITADWTVKKPTASNSKKLAGVCLTNAASGAKVSVIARGLVRATAYGTVVAGDQITVYASGKQVMTDNASLNTTVIGVAVQGASSGGTAYIELW